MAFLEVLATLFNLRPSEPAEPIQNHKLKPSTPPSALDCRPPGNESDITFGVRYASKYGWHIVPPAGWRRQESHLSVNWPNSNSSPTVTFINANLKAPEQALIRWTLLCLPETTVSHDKLAHLLCSNTRGLQVESLKGLEAPGLVAGMKVHKAELIQLGDGLPVLSVQTRLKHCQGEPPILRYMLILPDRSINLKGSVTWYRESLQFTATENSFWTNQPIATRSLMSFRRSPDKPFAITATVQPIGSLQL